MNNCFRNEIAKEDKLGTLSGYHCNLVELAACVFYKVHLFTLASNFILLRCYWNYIVHPEFLFDLLIIFIKSNHNSFGN